jgi:hypothetical protein
MTEYAPVSGYFDRDGKPIDVHRWAELKKDRSYVSVAQSGIGSGDVRLAVVTSWYGDSLNGLSPVVFETIVFGGATERISGRYATEAAALAGHRRETMATAELLGPPVIIVHDLDVPWEDFLAGSTP